jgi:hypothetical protein
MKKYTKAHHDKIAQNSDKEEILKATNQKTFHTGEEDKNFIRFLVRNDANEEALWQHV